MFLEGTVLGFVCFLRVYEQLWKQKSELRGKMRRLLRADAEATKRDDNLWAIAEEQSTFNTIKTLT